MSFDFEVVASILNGSDASIYAKDHNLRFIYVNPSVERLYKSSYAEMIGKTDVDFIDPSQASIFNDVDKRVIQSGNAEVVTSIIDINGLMYKVEDHKFPIQHAGHQGVAGIAFLTRQS